MKERGERNKAKAKFKVTGKEKWFTLNPEQGQPK